MNDKPTIRMVTFFLGFGLVGGMGAVTFLAAIGHPVPEALKDAMIAAGGALSGLLANTRGEPAQPPAQ